MKSRKAVWMVVFTAIAISTGVFFRMRRAEAAVALSTATVRQGEFLVVVRCRGELAARQSVQITAPLEVPDLQIVWLAPANSEVAPGQPVLRFDPSAARQQISEHTAALRAAQANLDQAVAQSRITSEQDKLDLAKAKYDVEKARLEASKQAVVSTIQGEESKIDSTLAEEKQRVQEATNNLHSKSDEAKIASLTRLRDQEERELKIMNSQIAAMEVKSPTKGVITYLTNTSQGFLNAQPFKVGDHVSSGAVIAEVPDLTTLEMEGKVEEVDRGQIQAGNSVLVHIDALPEKTWKAKLRAISPLTEQTWEWPPTRNFRTYAALDAPEKGLRPGMNASADIVIARLPNAISIPAKALFTHGGKPVVYLKTKTGFQATNVEVRARNPEEVAVAGLASGSAIALVEPVQEKNAR